jgi:hypothetical protein
MNAASPWRYVVVHVDIKSPINQWPTFPVGLYLNPPTRSSSDACRTGRPLLDLRR